MVVADKAAYRKLPASIAIHRAGLARLRGDIDGTVSHARRALELIGEDDPFGRASASALLGLAHWTNADLEAASTLYTESLARFEKLGFLADSLGLRISLADMQIARGRLRDALRTYEQGLEVAVRPDDTVLRGAADMHGGMAEVLIERNDLAGAADHLERAQILGEEYGLPQHPYRWRVAAARIRQAHGDLDAADTLLREAERRYITDFSPPVRPVTAIRARLMIVQGNLPEAWAWAREQALSAEDELGYVREYEHLTLARLMLAQATRDRASEPVVSVLDFLERLFAAAEGGGRVGAVIEVLIIQALAEQAMGTRAAALATLTRAIGLAEPEGYVRVFADEGPPMATLLKLAARQPNAPGAASRLLTAVVRADAMSPAAQTLIEPLSERELEVLRLLQGELDGPEIARLLTVSLPTVRTHTRNVYAKLGVNSRRAAVRRAADLGLLSRSR
jgi:LuxR family maltose regulon positive regulatory protein